MATAAHNSSSSGSACFDASVIDSFAGIMDAAAMRALLQDMERDVSTRVLRLSETRAVPGSLQAIAQDAHDLRSLGGNFGMVEMAARAGEVERAARAGSLDAVREILPVLIRAGDHALAILAARPEFGNRKKP